MIDGSKQYWTPEGPMRAAIHALHISGYSVERIADSVGTNVSFVKMARPSLAILIMSIISLISTGWRKVTHRLHSHDCS